MTDKNQVRQPELHFVDYGDDWYGVRHSGFGIPEGTATAWRAALAGDHEEKRLASIHKDGVVTLSSPHNMKDESDVVLVTKGVLQGWVDKISRGDVTPA